jgi:DNA primase
MTQTAFVDFAALKQQISISQVVQMLGLKMKQNGAQWRGECPSCRRGGERALAVNTDKQSYFCFSDRKGGDVIALVSHITGKSARDAAQQIATHFRFVGNGSQVPDTAPQAPKGRQGFDAQAYLKGLDPASEQLAPLGISPETLQHFGAGYCKTGLNRGRLAFALCDREGNILGFAGRALDTGQLTFPNGLEARDIIFGADKVGEGEVRLLREPLDVLQAYEVGEPAICFLTEEIEAQQCEQLAALLDIKKARIIL